MKERKLRRRLFKIKLTRYYLSWRIVAHTLFPVPSGRRPGMGGKSLGRASLRTKSILEEGGAGMTSLTVHDSATMMRAVFRALDTSAVLKMTFSSS